MFMWMTGAVERRQQEAVTHGLRVGGFHGVSRWSRLFGVLLAATLGVGCAPRVKVEAPDKPIEINVNVKIEQEVRIKLDKAVERTLEENPELFGTEAQP